LYHAAFISGSSMLSDADRRPALVNEALGEVTVVPHR
jgi:hypothetical protein